MFLQSAVLCAAGQPKYKDVYESVKTMKDYEAFQTLFHYQSATTSKDFVNVNGYYQMGLIAQKMMRQYDPFLQSQNTAQCIADATTYLSLALHYFDEKEAKKNGVYYQGVSGALTYENIKKDITGRLSDAAEYKKQFEQNLASLTNGIHKYNACIETFGNINEQNSRLNDLYFLADDALKKNLADLQTNFDSTLYYIGELKTALENYPMAGYQINYSLSPITEYRLHGLTAANVIAKEVKLWDFTSWVDAFNKVLTTDVSFLYRKAEEVYQANIALLERPGNAGVPPGGYAIDPLVINKIYQYDYNAVVAPLLKYQEAKINLRYHHAGNVADKSLPAIHRFAKSPDYYFELITQKQAVDSALRLTTDKTTPEAVKKYQAFFATHYKGFDGFKSYLKDEAAGNDLFLHTALDIYKDNVLEALEAAATDRIEYKNEPFYTTLVTPDKTGDAGYFIHAKTVLPDKKVFVTGSYVDKAAELTAFAALLNDDATIEWVKLLDKKGKKNRGLLATQADNGFAVVVAAGNDNETANYLYLLDPNGAVRKNTGLAATAVPRRLMYDDINETFLLAFKGASFQPYHSSEDALQVYRLKSDLSGDWKTDIPFTGYVSNIIKTNDRLYIYGAFSELTDAAGNSRTAGNKKTVAFVSIVNADGHRLTEEIFDAPFSYYPLYVSKISNEYVDMIAVKDALPDNIAAKQSPSYYLIISADNKVYYRY
jgi:hypothetical protein